MSFEDALVAEAAQQARFKPRKDSAAEYAVASLTLGDRMKRYEQAQSLHLTRRVPVIIRVDGRAFHTYTRDMTRPYSSVLIRSMVGAATDLATRMDGCRLAYVQSDEASFLLTDFARLETEAWFGYDLQKVVSLAAAGMTAWFSRWEWEPNRMKPVGEFDARAFNLPREEVANYFLWRAKDWHRNSVQMFAQAYFSPKELHGKKLPELHEMLHGIGRNWAIETSEQERNGTFIMDRQQITNMQPKYAEISRLVEEAMRTEEVES